MRTVAGSIILASSIVFGASPVCAFDTAHHGEMTWNALQREGFDEAAIRIVMLQNWLTDFYAGQEVILNASDSLVGLSEISGLPPGVRAIAAESALVKLLVRSGDLPTVENAVWLHFDNLDTTKAVDEYWNTLVSSTASQLYRFARQKHQDPLAILTLLGITLHAVQDFYSHSNWVGEADAQCSGSSLSGLTWFDAKQTGNMPSREIFTGAYPDSGAKNRRHSALNKDQLARPCWAEAYTVGYRATRQWVRAFGRFVESNNSSDLWTRCVRGVIVNGNDGDMLQAGLDASFRVSDSLGHWQGWMGSIYSVATEALEFASTRSTFKTAFTGRSILSELAGDLQARGVKHPLPSPIAGPMFDAVPDDENAVFIRIPDVVSTNSPTDLSCEVNDDMFFVRLSLAAAPPGMGPVRQEFRTATDVGNCRGPRVWRALWFVPKTPDHVDLTIALWNEGVKPGRRVPAVDSYRIDIEPAGAGVELRIVYKLTDGTCTIGGVSRSCDEARGVEIAGDTVPRARIRFFLETRTIRAGP